MVTYYPVGCGLAPGLGSARVPDRIGDTDRALPELLALADTNPAGMAAIEALGPAALAAQHRGI